MKLIDKDVLIAEIEKKRDEALPNSEWNHGYVTACEKILSFLEHLEVKEVENVPNIQFPHYKNIVDKVFGAGNLENFEYDEAERLVLLSKEELLKDLEVKEVDLEKEVHSQMDLLCNLLGYMDELSNGDSEGIFPLPGKVMEDLQKFAKHFFELGLKTKKRAVCRNTSR